jgi:hypothetical protein
VKAEVGYRPPRLLFAGSILPVSSLRLDQLGLLVFERLVHCVEVVLFAAGLAPSLTVWGALKALPMALAPLVFVFPLFHRQILEGRQVGLAWRMPLQILKPVEIIRIPLIDLRGAFSCGQDLLLRSPSARGRDHHVVKVRSRLPLRIEFGEVALPVVCIY